MLVEYESTVRPKSLTRFLQKLVVPRLYTPVKDGGIKGFIYAIPQDKQGHHLDI